MAWTRAALALLAAGAVAVAVVSGGSSADPRTPPALPGLPPPFLGTAVAGGSGLTAAIDAYGDVVDLRAPGPAGRALIANPAARQAAGTVAAATGIVPRVRIGAGPALPLWRAASISQSYLSGTDVVRTAARFGRHRVTVLAAAAERRLALIVTVREAARGEDRVEPGRPRDGGRAVPALSVDTDGVACRATTHGAKLGLVCMRSAVPLSRTFLASQPGGGVLAYRRGESPFIVAAEAIVARAADDDRTWLAAAEPLGDGAPAWARSAYRRSLLTLRALTDRRSGAVAAGARDGWAYVWPRDAGAVALAYAAAGFGSEARRVARFLVGLDLGAAARFHGDGSAVEGRAAQGDAAGWVDVAARAAGLPADAGAVPWRERADYQEGAPGDYLANALAARRPAASINAFLGPAGLSRKRHDPASGLDSAAAWAVRPFAQPVQFPAVRRTLLHLLASSTNYGITPGDGWPGGDPWTAPTAWSAWALATLSARARRAGEPTEAAANRRAALALLADLRRAATPAGALPERVDSRTGIPRSTTPLAWSHAFAILALRQLWP